MGIKDRIIDKAEDTQVRLAAEARSRFYLWVMKEEGCDLDRAVDLCLGETDPVVPEYTLGWKLADPIVQLGLFNSGEKTREKFIKKLEEDLTPEELKLFREEVLTQNAKDRFDSAMEERKAAREAKKAAKKEAKAAKKAKR